MKKTVIIADVQDADDLVATLAACLDQDTISNKDKAVIRGIIAMVPGFYAGLDAMEESGLDARGEVVLGMAYGMATLLSGVTIPLARDDANLTELGKNLASVFHHRLMASFQSAAELRARQGNHHDERKN